MGGLSHHRARAKFRSHRIQLHMMKNKNCTHKNVRAKKSRKKLKIYDMDFLYVAISVDLHIGIWKSAATNRHERWLVILIDSTTDSCVHWSRVCWMLWTFSVHCMHWIFARSWNSPGSPKVFVDRLTQKPHFWINFPINEFWADCLHVSQWHT